MMGLVGFMVLSGILWHIDAPTWLWVLLAMWVTGKVVGGILEWAHDREVR